jgi:alkyldihydroxyacetonephosphate synthase
MDDAHRPHAEDTRIVPEPPARSEQDAESPDVWGFADSGFEIDAAGRVVFRGSRYPISGKVIPDLLPWAEGILGLPLPPSDAHEPRYPAPVPARIVCEPFEVALRTRLAEEQLCADAAVRLRHGHGHTQEDMWAVKYGQLPRVPDLVVWPASEVEVDFLVQCARDHGVALIPFGGGTNVTDALRCPEQETREIVSVDMRRMNRVLWIDPENRLAEIEAGATGREIEAQLGRFGFTMGHEPDSIELSTLGGWVATHASGMKKNRYGNIEDIVLAVRAATTAGRLARPGAAPRESVGSDPTRWMLGSEGRLGIVTRAVVKIFPLPAVRRFGSVLFRDFETGFAFLRDAQRAGVAPASIRLMDNLQFQFGQAVRPRREGLEVLKSRLERAFVTRVRGFQVDKMVACTLLFEGSAEEVAAQERAVYRLAKRQGGLKAGGSNGERGYQLTFAIAYIRDFMMRHWVLGESFETSVPWSRALALCENVKQRLFQEHAKRGLPGRPFVSCRVTQLYETGVCVYFYFAFHYKGVEAPSEVFAELERAARDEILGSGGSLSHHHGVGKLRQAFLPRVLSPAALAWRQRLKQAVDPDGVFGCGN